MFIWTSLVGHGQDKTKSDNNKSFRTILFICEHGAGRSAIAAAFFNKIAKEKKLNYQAIFRGLDPDSAVGPGVRQGLTKDSFDIIGWKPTLLSRHDIETAYRIVTLDCVLADKDTLGKPISKWSEIPISKGYIAARDEILSVMQILIQDLLKEHQSKY